MSFPFKKITPKVFSKTFLKDVEMEVLFTSVDFHDDEVFQQGVRNLFESNFPNVITDEWRFTEDGFTVTSDTETHQYGFRPGATRARLRFPAYTTFTDMEKVLHIPLRYMEISCARECESITLRKFNELKFEIEKVHGSDMVEVMEQLFSKKLLTYMNDWDQITSQLAKDRDITRWERTLYMDDAEVSGRVVYGFVTDVENPARGSLILKIIMQSSGDSIEYDGDMVKRKLTDLNEWCDSAFEWALTPDMLSEMQQS